MQVSENLALVPVLLSVIGFLLVWVLYSIKEQLKDLKDAFLGLREYVVGIDRRVTVMETRCETSCQKDD